MQNNRKEQDFLIIAWGFGLGILLGLLGLFNYIRLEPSALWSERVVDLLFCGLLLLTGSMVLAGVALFRLNRGHLKSKRVLQGMRFLLHTVYPALFWVSRMIRIPKDSLNRSYITYNNRVVMNLIDTVPRNKVLLLLPHCIQWSGCPHKVVGNVDRCVDCGKCTVSLFKTLKEETGISMVIATGGTLARKAIKDQMPQLILAVACERDLAAGIYDAKAFPVLGIHNQRPEGPCKNTWADVEEIRRWIERYSY